MSNIAIVFWSGTGNTEAMADAVKAGAQEAGAEVSVFNASDFSADMVADFDAIAFGCPAMGDEVLEEDEFQPMFDALRSLKSGRFCLTKDDRKDIIYLENQWVDFYFL